MKRIVTYLLVFLLLLPISFSFLSNSIRGLYIAPSDLIIFALLALPWIIQTRTISSGSRRIITISIYAFIIFCLIGAAGALINSDTITNVLSAVNFSKFFLMIPVGYVCTAYLGAKRLFSAITIAIVLFPIVLVVSDALFNRGWPKPRWGEYVFGFQVHGHPNLSTLFLVFLFTGLLSYYLHKKDKQLIVLIPLVLFAMFPSLSLSRNAVLSQILAIGLCVILTRRTNIRAIAIIVGSCCALVFFVIVYMEPIANSLVFRYETTLRQIDTFSHRKELWLVAIELFQEKPVFGHMFVSFSTHSWAGSTHQQYLEVLYKTGLIGFIVYFNVIAQLLKVLLGLNRRHRSPSTSWLIVWMITAWFTIMFSNLFQPNFTYSITSNAFLFMIGMLLAYDDGHTYSIARMLPKTSNLMTFSSSPENVSAKIDYHPC